jgi:hypothetical protein
MENFKVSFLDFVSREHFYSAFHNGLLLAGKRPT